MKRERHTLIWIVFLFVIAISVLVAAFLWLWGHWVFKMDHEEKIDGFNDELLDLLGSEYNLIIPEEATFVDGYYDKSLFGDFYVFFAFDLDLKNYMGDKYENPESDEELTALIGETVMSFSSPENAYVEFSERYGDYKRYSKIEASFLEEICVRFDRKYIGQYEHTDEAENYWTSLWISAVKDGVISFCLVGER